MKISHKINLSICFTVALSFFVTMIITASRSDETTKELTYDLATEAAHHQGQIIKSELEQYLGLVRSLELSFQEMVKHKVTSRRLINDILISTVKANPSSLLGAWMLWEPNAFDGRDNEYINAPEHDHTGRVNSYWHWDDKNNVVLENNVEWQDATWYEVPRKAKTPVLLDPYIYKVSGVDTMLVSLIAPIMLNGQFSGVVGVDFKLSELQQRISRVQALGQGYATLISNDGTYITNVDNTKIGKKLDDSKHRKETLESINKGESIITVSFDTHLGEEVHNIYTPLKISGSQLPWSLAVTIPTKVITTPSTELKKYTFLIDFISLLVIITIVISLLNHFVSKPLQILERAVQRFGRGAGQLEVPVNSSDEIGSLSKSFNTMALQVEKSQHSLKGLFENADTSLWDEDFSEVVSEFNQLRRNGINDLRLHLETNKYLAWELLDKVKIVHVNKATLKLFNADTEQQFKSQTHKIFDSNFIDIFIDELCAIWNKQAFFRTVATLLTLDNKSLDVIISFQIPRKDKEFQSIPISIIDMTERKRLEEQIRRSQKMDAVGQLAGGIAHDFNNILGIIQGNTELMQRSTQLDAKFRGRIDSIMQSTERAANLTQQLLGFSRREVAGVEIININESIMGMDNMIERSLTPEITVDYQLSSELWNVEVDSGDFKDALLNLLINARDAIAGSGIIHVETTNKTLDDIFCRHHATLTPGDYVHLAIIDNGEGITSETMEQIFEPFFTTKPQGKGTGLGLSMVFGFVQRSNGDISSYSEPGVSTGFDIFIPRAADDVHEIDSGNKALSLPTGNESILVVDDELGLQEFARDTLESLGYKVFVANDALQAMDILQNESGIDLLFSDVVMPGGVNGYNLAEQATSLIPTIGILLTSGYIDKVTVDKSQDYFSTTLLHKPYTMTELAQRIRRALDMSHR